MTPRFSFRDKASFFFILCLVLVLAVPPRASAEEEKLHAQKSLERRQRIELLGFFLKEPGKADLPQTNLAIELYNQGVEFYEQKEYDMAIEAFEDSLQYNPENALAYEIMGDIYYFQQEMGKARENYQKAFQLQPREALKTKIQKVREEAVVEKDLSTYRERHFIIKYHNDDGKHDGFELRELLRETYNSISRDFGFYFQHKVVVLLYDADEFKDLTKQPHWVAGLYDGKIRMPAQRKGFGDEALAALTAHEMTHAFVAAISKGRAPVWINEGLAEFQENKVVKNDLIVFKAAIKTGRLIPLDQLMNVTSATSMGDPLMVNLFYEQSFHLVSYLIDRYSMFRIKQLLQSFAEGKNADDALQEVLKISIPRLEREWKDTF